MSLLYELAARTTQRSLEDIAAECDVLFGDRVIEGLDFQVVNNPFKAALDCARKEGHTALALFGGHFLVVPPDARWMQALRIYQSIQEELRIREKPI